MSGNKSYLTEHQCEYFSLWDTGTKSLSEWGEQLYEANESRAADQSSPSLYEREDIDEPDTLGNVKRKLDLAEETRIQESLPTECPHGAVDGEEHCLFHLSVEQVETHDEITPKVVSSEFFDKVQQTTEGRRDTRKCFAGSKFAELSIQYQSLSSKSNRPVQLQFAQIESLNLHSAIVDEQLILDECEIRSISCENTQFQREVSLENSSFDCDTIWFDGAVFDEQVSFDGSNLTTTSVKFEDCEFKDDTGFNNVEITLDSYKDANVRPTATFKNTVFQGVFGYTHGSITVSDEINSDVSVKFNDCHFEGGADLSYLSLDPAEELKSGEEAGMGSDNPWGDGNSVTDDEFSVEMNLFIQESDFAEESKFGGLRIEGDLELNGVEFSRGNVNFESIAVARDANFDGTTFGSGNLSFYNAEIGGEASFERALFGTGVLRFEKSEVVGDANFEKARFSGYNANFDGFITKGSLSLKGTVFNVSGGDIHFTDVAVGGRANFYQARFSAELINFCGLEILGGGKYGSDGLQANFKETNWEGSVIKFGLPVESDSENCTINGKVGFELASFVGKKVIFENMTVEEGIEFEHAEFDTLVTDFSGIELRDAEKFDMSHTEFSSNEVYFNDMDLTCNEVTFEEATFDSNVNFSGLEVTDPGTFEEDSAFDMSHVDFCSDDAKFKRVKLDCDHVTFEEALFNSDAIFPGLEVINAEKFNMSHMMFSSHKANFSGLKVINTEKFDMSHTTFSSDNISFRGITLDCDIVNFESATFDSNISFSTLQPSKTDPEIEHAILKDGESERVSRIVAGTFNMSQAQIIGNIDFTEVKLKCDNILFNQTSAEGAIVNFDGVESGDTRIEFRDGIIMDGKFHIDGCETVYDFTGATIGDISITNEGNGDLFEHFIFRDTDFDGFDFSNNKVKANLKQTGWNIHTSHDKRKKVSGGYLQTAIRFLKRSHRLIREGPLDEATNPDKLETTYMKARLGADLQGDPDTVSQFFKKELHFRRHAYGYQFWDRSTSKAQNDSETERESRVKLAWDWIANMTLAVTVGYGERPSNVVLTSVFVIFSFFFVYRGISALPAGSTNIEYLTYSVQGFIQLIVAVETSGGILVRLFTAIEGFIGAFIIALFVITLTRSIDR